MLATQKGRSKPVRISSRRWLRLIPPPERSAAIVKEERDKEGNEVRRTVPTWSRNRWNVWKLKGKQACGDASMPVRKLRPMRDKSGRDTHPRATMQKFEKKGVLGRASWKWLKIKVQICR